MKSCWAIRIFILFNLELRGLLALNEPTNSANLDCESEKMRDKAGFEAIKTLHKSMDDDLSGTVDLSESIEFVREELQIKEKDRMDKRQKVFHQNDDEFISVDDLWCRWVTSEERRWTTDRLLDWLENGVELPQYKNIFLLHNVRGLVLPRIAVQNTSYLSTSLGVVNPVHRQKIQLKALDVVLFGYKHVKPSYWKDVILVSLLCLAVGGYWFAVSQRTTAQQEMSRLSNQMDKLKDIEEEFQDLQSKFHEEKRKKESIEKKADLKEMEKAEQVETLRNQLMHAERLWEKRHPLLQNLLRKTYELEMNRINQQKMTSLREMTEAREMVEKFRKKQTSLFNQIRTVHGADMEVIDERILGLKTKLEETTRWMDECTNRWSQIESLSGFSLMNSPSTHVHPSTSLPGAPKKGLNGVASNFLPLNIANVPIAYNAGFVHSYVTHPDDCDDLGKGNDFGSNSGSEGRTDLHAAGLIKVSTSSSSGFERPSVLFDNDSDSLRSSTLNESTRHKFPVIFDVVNSSLNSAQRSVSAADLNAPIGRLPNSPSVNDVRKRENVGLIRTDTQTSFAESSEGSGHTNFVPEKSTKPSKKPKLKDLFKSKKSSAQSESSFKS